MNKFKKTRELVLNVCNGLLSASWKEETEVEACEVSSGKVIDSTFVEADQEQKILDRSDEDTALSIPAPKKLSK